MGRRGSFMQRKVWVIWKRPSSFKASRWAPSWKPTGRGRLNSISSNLSARPDVKGSRTLTMEGITMKHWIIALSFVALFSCSASAQSLSIWTSRPSVGYLGSVIVGQPTTHWSRISVSLRPTNWKNVTVVGAFSAQLLSNPVSLPFGSLKIDLSSLIHYDPSMSVRPMLNTSPTEAIVWTKVPALPKEAIGAVIWYQLLLYSKQGSPNHVLSDPAQITVAPN